MTRPYVREMRPAEVVVFPHALVEHHLVSVSLAEGEQAIDKVQAACRLADHRYIIVLVDMKLAQRAMGWAEQTALQDLMWAVCAGADYVCPLNMGNMSYFTLKTDWWIPAHKTLVAVRDTDDPRLMAALLQNGNLAGFWAVGREKRIALERQVPGYQRWISKKALELRKKVAAANPAIFLHAPS